MNLSAPEDTPKVGKDLSPTGGGSPTVGHQGAEDPKGAPMPKVAYHLIPADLHRAVRDLVPRLKGLWDGQLGHMDITPHGITLGPGTKPVRSQLYWTGLHNRKLTVHQVAKKLKLEVIKQLQVEWSFSVDIVPKAEETPLSCVDL